ncbi:O-antigen ligase family protein [Olleya sp. YS]|uniref:O-antigen ligase family protein n=1 Tax=Olleya sp. YS TaxID=3028318 RepID=UPI0024341106|nr:O-antigen ligase family protein [Olleya sp. YS]WGD35764.1 O-antigen ligase family protein [Olleya sp. YS]
MRTYNLDFIKKIEQLPYLLLFLLSFFPILNIKILSILSLLFFSSSIFLNLKNIKVNYIKIGCKPLLVNCLFYLLLVVSILYSPLKSTGADFLIRQIGLLLMPIILIYAIKIPNRLIKYMTIVFIGSNILVVIYFIVKLNLIQDFINQPSAFFNTSYFIEISNSLDYKDWHATYIAINNLLACVFLANYITKPKAIQYKVLAVFLIGFFLVFSLILNSRIIFLLNLLIIPFFLFFKIKTVRFKVITLISMLLLFFLLFKVSNNNKLGRIFEHPVQYYVSNFSAKTVLGVRYQVQKCSVELISRSPLLGYGIGYEKSLLTDYCFEVKNFQNKYLKSYTSHNVYLSTMFSAGIFALLALLYMLFNNLVLGIKQRDLTYVSFLIIFILGFLTENYLIRLNGILLFAFLNSYFYQKNYIKN